MHKTIHTDQAPAAIGPYVQAKEAGGMLFISGQIPADPASGEIIHGIEDATHQVMKNLKAILEAASLDFSHVVKASIFLKDMNDFQKMNEVYASYFSADSFPARETVQVSCLPKNVEVEISMIACR